MTSSHEVNSTALEASLSGGEENLLLDKETLENVAHFIDKLHQARTKPPHFDDNLVPLVNENGSSPKFELDSKTERSVGKLITALNEDKKEGLATELGEIVKSFSSEDDVEVKSVTLEAIGHFIDSAVSKQRRTLSFDTTSSSDQQGNSKDHQAQTSSAVLESLGHFARSPAVSASEGLADLPSETLASIGDFIDNIALSRGRSPSGQVKDRQPLPVIEEMQRNDTSGVFDLGDLKNFVGNDGAPTPRSLFDDNTITTKGTLEEISCLRELELSSKRYNTDTQLQSSPTALGSQSPRSNALCASLSKESSGEKSMKVLKEIFNEVDRSRSSSTSPPETKLLSMIEDYVETFATSQTDDETTAYDSSKVPPEARAIVDEFIDLVHKKRKLGCVKLRELESSLPEHLQKFRLKQPGSGGHPKDPPSSLPSPLSKVGEGNGRLADPPLVLTVSEEDRIRRVGHEEPERNTKHVNTRSGSAIRDPELVSSTPLFDTTGELVEAKRNKQKKRRKKKDIHSGGLVDTFYSAMSDDTDSPEEPSTEDGQRDFTSEEKKEECENMASKESNSDLIAELMHRLAKLVLPSKPSSTELKKLVNLTRFAYPHIKGRSPPASSVAKVMFEAKNNNLDLTAADNLLNLAHAYYEAEERTLNLELVPSDELVAVKISNQMSPRVAIHDEEVIDFLSRLVEFGEKNSSSSPVDEADADGVLVREGDEAIEVDLKDGFVNKELSTGLSADAPWWEVVAKLSGDEFQSHSDDLFTSHSDNENNFSMGVQESRTGESEQKAYSEVDVKKYWEERNSSQPKHFGYPHKTIDSMERSGEYEPRSSSEWVTPSLSTAESSDAVKDAWTRRKSMALWDTNGANRRTRWSGQESLDLVSVDDPDPINAVSATAEMFVSGKFRRRVRSSLPFVQAWKRTYVDRTDGHKGFLGVHVHSLYASTRPFSIRTEADTTPWEYRCVKQRFLHEQSASFRRNWFGVLRPKAGNSIVKYSVVSVSSMPMPIKANDWSDEWYQNPWENDDAAQRQYYASGNDPGLLDVPECGRIRSTRLKIGERVTRVTPDLTSSLRRSRWRKKHFPRGSFPY